jgi:hypothetical protein
MMKIATRGVTISLIASLPGSRFKWQLKLGGQIPKTPARLSWRGVNLRESAIAAGLMETPPVEESPVAFSDA